MISLFETVWEAPRGLPLELVTRGVRGVSLLEFVSCDAKVEPLEQRPATAESISAGDATDERAHQVMAMVEAARKEAARTAKDEYDAELEARTQVERERAQRVCDAFAKEREHYFAAAEEQVVQLALAIARRVLAREVAADAMHLTATVRAALARVQDGSRCVLRVPVDEVEAWAGLLGGDAEVVGETRVQRGECVLESRVGRVELGVRPQMDEIERGFGELMEREAA